MQIACYRTTLRGRNPEVGAARIEDNLEGLRGSSKADFGKVWSFELDNAKVGRGRGFPVGPLTLRVQVVLNRNRVILRGNERMLLPLALGEGVPAARVLLFEVLDLVLHGERLLFIDLAMIPKVGPLSDGAGGVTNHLLLKGHLLNLHLVDSSRLGGGAKDCHRMRRQYTSYTEPAGFATARRER